MTKTLKQFKTRVLAKPEVRIAYDALQDEFAFIDEELKARTALELTQPEARTL
jgi:hypothetical protein